MEPTLEELIDMAHQAGEILRGGFGKQHEVDHKGRIDLVTEMDRAAEDYLIGQIRARYPDHAIESEESGEMIGLEGHRWFIDPLDGTTNYAHHVPIFAVSLAYAKAGQMQLGVVYDPMRSECFSAIRGQGAWLDGRPIHVSDTRELVRSLLVTGFPYDPQKLGISNLEHFAHFTRLTQGVRRMGSAAIDLCYVASGRFDGYWEQTLRAWDLAAGTLIVEEAGGLVTTLKGNSDYIRHPYDLLAGNPHIHALILEELAHVTA